MVWGELDVLIQHLPVVLGPAPRPNLIYLGTYENDAMHFVPTRPMPEVTSGPNICIYNLIETRILRLKSHDSAVHRFLAYLTGFLNRI